MAPRPSAFRAHVEVNGDAQVSHFIKQIGYRAAHTRPLMEKLVGMLEIQQRRRVESEPWTPLTEGTTQRKISENENPNIFRDEQRRIKGSPTRVPDAMYRALTVPGAPGQLRYVTRASASWGLKSAGHGELFYARFVQNVKGTKRRILAITPDDALILIGFVEMYIMGEVGGEIWQRDKLR